jgi:hypothetical protein
MSTTLRFEPGVDHEPAGAVVQPHAGAPAHIRLAPATGHVFKDILRDALYLLSYAIEAGIVVDAELAQRIIAAEQRGEAAWDDASAGLLLNDITKLGALVHPVTAVTLRASQQQAHATIRNYRWIAVVLALCIVPWSILSFIFAGINTSITIDIAAANQLVVSLHTQLEPAPAGSGETTQLAPIDALPDLQQLASTIRSIYRHSNRLTWFVPNAERNPVTRATRLELDTDLARQMGKLRANLDELTAVYQQIRSYAKYTQDDGAAAYGAVTTCLLPILYALLGACAYMLRTFSGQLATHTFAPSYSTSARFVIAAIAGGVVGLFNNFGTSQAAALSPLAIAFVAGYAVDVFFSLIDGAVNSVSKPRGG